MQSYEPQMLNNVNLATELGADGGSYWKLSWIRRMSIGLGQLGKIDSDKKMASCLDYIHYNPVRVGIARR